MAGAAVMVWIHTSNGPAFCIDDEDEALVRPHNWDCKKDKGNNTIYPRMYIKKRGWVVHRFLLKPPVGMVVDHIDGNGMNNCRSNLRIVTAGQNAKNQTKRIYRGKPATSQYKGVSKIATGWTVHICVNYKLIGLGTYWTELEGAIVYDEASLKYHGEFGRRNFPGGPPPCERLGKKPRSNGIILYNQRRKERAA